MMCPETRRILHQSTLSSSLVWVSWRMMTRKEAPVTGAKIPVAETHIRRLQEDQAIGFTWLSFFTLLNYWNIVLKVH